MTPRLYDSPIFILELFVNIGVHTWQKNKYVVLSSYISLLSLILCIQPILKNLLWSYCFLAVIVETA